MEYTVHFQKGRVVGARQLHMVHVDATSVDEAIDKASKEHATWVNSKGFRMVRVDHFEGNSLVIDYGDA